MQISGLCVALTATLCYTPNRNQPKGDFEMNYIRQGVWLRLAALILLTLFAVFSSPSISFGQDFNLDLVEPMQPEFFAGTYRPIEFIENDMRRGPSEIAIQQITIVADKLSNTLKTYSGQGDIFLVPFYNINLESKMTTENFSKFCIESEQSSKSYIDSIETRVTTRKKWSCNWVIKETQDLFSIAKTAREDEIIFTEKHGRTQLNTYRFKRVQ